MRDLVTRRSRAVGGVAGPLLFVQAPPRVRLGEMVLIRMPDGERRGQVIELSEQHAVIQVLEETLGLRPDDAEVTFTGEVATLAVGRGMLGRVLDGMGRPSDGLPPPVPEAVLPLGGVPINPVRRARPAELIETGISAIDGLATLVRGQKLPIFSGAGLPAPRLAAQVVRQARVAGGEPFAVVFCGMGIPAREADFYLASFQDVAERTAVILNRASDPTIERLLAPRCALSLAEFLAFNHGIHVLVILTDMTSYCEALREVALAREEIPARRGYPGDMYTDLASIYERAGLIQGRAGSVTQLPIVTMPDDDITHPVPDLTGYVTEGQLVLSRELHRRGVFPPIDVLPSLSRLMNGGIGPGRTREDHRALADQLYAFYARGREVRRMEAIVGAEGLTTEQRGLLAFAERFEQGFIHQGAQRRTIGETLETGWQMLAGFAPAALNRIPESLIARYRPQGALHGEIAGDTHGAAGGQGDPARG
ncbi:MAG: V-type ATP synthase subunit B [Myxococcota bacterium]